jgi:hypothetical protein
MDGLKDVERQRHNKDNEPSPDHDKHQGEKQDQVGESIWDRAAARQFSIIAVDAPGTTISYSLLRGGNPDRQQALFKTPSWNTCSESIRIVRLDNGFGHEL